MASSWCKCGTGTCAVFQAIHDHLINEDIVSVQQVLQPRQLPTLEQLCLSHDRDYVTRFLAGVLPPDIERRIGLREAIKEPVLIERTLWEVSGAANRECRRVCSGAPLVSQTDAVSLNTLFLLSSCVAASELLRQLLHRQRREDANR